MKQFILSAIFIIIFKLFLFAQAPDTLWTKTFGGGNFDFGYSVQQTFDGGYVIAGETSSFGVGGSDVWLIKTDANGDTLWTKTYGSSLFDGGYSVQQTSDGGYIITGNFAGTAGTDSDVWLIKTDSNGDSLWTKTFGKDFVHNFGYSVQQTSDGGYIVAGTTQTFGIGTGEVYLIKTDVNGDSAWTRKFGFGGGRSEGFSVQQTSDEGYIITGFTSALGPSGAGDVLLIKTDANGNSLWTKNYGEFGFDTGRSVQQTSDGGYIITGFYTTSGTDPNLWLLKTDANGDTLWTKFFDSGFSDDGYAVKQTSDGGYILTGLTGSTGDIWLIKTDVNGDSLWTKTFGGSGIDQGNSVQQTSDGGYIITGYTGSFGSGSSDVWLIKVAPDVTAIDDDVKTIAYDYALQQNYPNPFNPSTTIKFSIPSQSFTTLKVYDVLGNEIVGLVNEQLPAGNYKFSFVADNLPSGIYFYRITSGSFTAVKKMTLLR